MVIKLIRYTCLESWVFSGWTVLKLCMLHYALYYTCIISQGMARVTTILLPYMELSSFAMIKQGTSNFLLSQISYYFENTLKIYKIVKNVSFNLYFLICIFKTTKLHLRFTVLQKFYPVFYCFKEDLHPTIKSVFHLSFYMSNAIPDILFRMSCSSESHWV